MIDVIGSVIGFFLVVIVIAPFILIAWAVLKDWLFAAAAPICEGAVNNLRVTVENPQNSVDDTPEILWD